MAAEIEVRIVALRRAHPSWGPRTISYHLEKEGVTPVPSRSVIYRSLIRHRRDIFVRGELVKRNGFWWELMLVASAAWAEEARDHIIQRTGFEDG